MTTDNGLSMLVDRITKRYKELIGDGSLSFSDVLSLMGCAAATFLQAVRYYISPATTHRQTVLVLLDKFYNDVIAPIDIKIIPNLIEPWVDKGLKSLVLLIVGSWLDTLEGIIEPAPKPDENVSFPPVPRDPYASMVLEPELYLPSFLRQK